MPKLTIAITTYNRKELLTRAIQAALQNDDPDLEVIVGNDYVAEPLNLGQLGVSDPRVRIFNHPVNLRELGNMAFLLEHARGEYFTWLADDDALAPEFFDVIRNAIRAYPSANVIYTGYGIQKNPSDLMPAIASTPEFTAFSGKEFLVRVLGGGLKVIGPYGVFRTEVLRSIGGMEPVLDGAKIGLYSEWLLLFKLAQLREVVFCPEPLVYYLQHEESWGVSNTEVELYQKAGLKLVSSYFEICGEVSPGEMRKQFAFIVHLVLRQLLSKTFAASGAVSVREVRAYYRAIQNRIPARLDASRRRAALTALRGEGFSLLWPLQKAKLKSHLPQFFLALIYRLLRRPMPRLK
jgi:glycosyltransferase involved in cell wall biosynthesis